MKAKHEPGDIVETKDIGRGLVILYEEDSRPLVALPGNPELTLIHDSELTLIANIEDITKQAK